MITEFKKLEVPEIMTRVNEATFVMPETNGELLELVFEVWAENHRLRKQLVNIRELLNGNTDGHSGTTRVPYS